MPLEIGNTFFVDERYTHIDPQHPWIIISRPSDNPKKIAIVNITSWKDRAFVLNDSSCIINPGEYPTIKHKSCVFYRKGNCTTLDKLEEGFRNSTIKQGENCSKELLMKILDGAAKSPFLPLEIRQILEQQGLID
jgi:hypothetical protein